MNNIELISRVIEKFLDNPQAGLILAKAIAITIVLVGIARATDIIIRALHGL